MLEFLYYILYRLLRVHRKVSIQERAVITHPCKDICFLIYFNTLVTWYPPLFDIFSHICLESFFCGSNPFRYKPNYKKFVNFACEDFQIGYMPQTGCSWYKGMTRSSHSRYAKDDIMLMGCHGLAIFSTLFNKLRHCRGKLRGT